MTKREFLMALNDALGPMTGDERSAAIKYYSDYIDDAGEDNLDAVLAELGSPQQVAASILEDAGINAAGTTKNVPPQARTEEKRNTPGGLPIWALVMIVLLLSPAWMPLLGVLVGVLGCVLGLLVALFAMTLALVIGGVVSIFAGLLAMTGNVLAGAMGVGIGCAMTGFGVFLTMLCVFLCRTVIPIIARGIVNFFRNLFHKKGERNA